METLAHRFLNAPVEMLGVIPRDRAVQRSVRAQRPFLLEYPDCPASQAVLSIAGKLSRIHQGAPTNGGMKAFLDRLGGLFKRQ